jgi:hypothetical protein
MLRLLVVSLVLLLSACDTYMPQRYSTSADNTVLLRAMGPANAKVGSFSDPADFDRNCRAAGPLAPPDGMTFGGYIQKALTDELKVAGLYDDRSTATLTGELTRLEFSSSKGLTGGSWDIDLTVKSSNGKSVSASEHYEFNSGFVAITACKQTAEAYLPAVQNLINKLVKDPGFRDLLAR